MSNDGKSSSFGALMTIVAVILGAIFVIAANYESGDRDVKADSVTVDKKVESGVKTETKKEVMKFDTVTVEDPNLEYGKTETRTAGVNGEVTHTYEVVYEEGKEVSRKQVGQEVTKRPIDRVIARGVKVVWHCVDVTSYNKNPYDDNRCTSSKGEVRYASDSEARALDPSYSPGQFGHPYYNSK